MKPARRPLGAAVSMSRRQKNQAILANAPFVHHSSDLHYLSSPEAVVLLIITPLLFFPPREQKELAFLLYVY